MNRIISALILTLAIAVPAVAEEPRASLGQIPASEAQVVYDDIKQTLGIVPRFLKDYPPGAIGGAWNELKALQLSDKTAVPPKYKELMGLAVASQIPCTYCIQFHSTVARANAATEAELKEAVAISSCTRHWSTYLGGMQVDRDQFRRDVDIMTSKLRENAAKPEQPAMTPSNQIVTAEDAYRDIELILGSVPTFMRQFPKGAVAGAWRDLRDLELNPATAVAPKYKALLALAVSSQIPCEHCVYWDTANARLHGATDEEIAETVGMASLTRKWSTVLNGLQTDPNAFRAEVSRIMSYQKSKNRS